MADFCNQCAEDLGLPKGDMKGIGDGTPLKEGYGWTALCECCGPCLVNEEGDCIGGCWCDLGYGCHSKGDKT